VKSIGIIDQIAIANMEAVGKMINSEPELVGVDTAVKCIPGFKSKMILHAGPPIEWQDMCGALKGAIIGAVLHEGWCENTSEAERLIESGEIDFEPCHNHSAVGPMAGVISPSMPVFVIKDKKDNRHAFTNFNEGLGKALRFGAFDREVMTKLEWMKSKLAPILKEVLNTIVSDKGGIALKPIIAQALQMGDECHNRNLAGTSLLLRELIPVLISIVDKDDAVECYSFINCNNHFFLNLVLAACKCMADAGHGVAYSTVVTAIARNGTNVGLRVSGVGDEWFTGPAPIPEGLYFPGFSKKDANPDMGDSTITETVGLGGAAMAASPSIVKFVGGNTQDALEMTKTYKLISILQHRHFTIPYMDFEGTPIGIDIRKVLRTGITPRANTGIAHKCPGVGQIGAGIVTLPIEPFEKALYEYVRKYEI